MMVQQETAQEGRQKKNRSWDPGGISLLKVETANAHTQIEIAKVVQNVATTKVEQNDGKKIALKPIYIHTKLVENNNKTNLILHYSILG